MTRPQPQVGGLPRNTWRRLVADVIAEKSKEHSNGYRLTYIPLHPAANPTYVYEHRLVMECKLGRYLAPHEHVHHINEDKQDNRPENLELVTGSVHQVIHRSGIADSDVARLINNGWTSREIVALGVATHRIARVRRELREVAA